MPRLPNNNRKLHPVRRDENFLRHFARYFEEVLDTYKEQVADAFVVSVEKHELEIRQEPEIYQPAPYETKTADNVLLLREYLFKFGTSEYCIVYDFSNGIVSLLGMCYARTNRNMGYLRRIWVPR